MAKQANVPVTPVQAKVILPGDAAKAYRVFTACFGEWWPFATHSVYRKDSAGCTFEPTVGGRIVERSTDGRETVWGLVIAVDEPNSVKFSWHPGQPEATAQEITVRFTPMMMFGTTVELEHGGWDKLGDKAKELRAEYERNWPGVLEKLAARGAKPA